jgi:hypothetical protein
VLEPPVNRQPTKLRGNMKPGGRVTKPLTPLSLHDFLGPHGSHFGVREPTTLEDHYNVGLPFIFLGIPFSVATEHVLMRIA